MKEPPGEGGRPPPPEQHGRVEALVRAEEIRDLRAALRDAEKRERRHWAVAVFGVSPSVAVVALGLLAAGAFWLLVVFSVLVTVVEAWRARRAADEARSLEERLVALGRQAEPTSPAPPPGAA